LRDQKDKAIRENKQLSTQHLEKMNRLADDYNVKLAATESHLAEARERRKYEEERSYEIMMAQEAISKKWKHEHTLTVQAYEEHLKKLRYENKHMKEKITELRG
jgi:hypothetical protein